MALEDYYTADSRRRLTLIGGKIMSIRLMLLSRGKEMEVGAYAISFADMPSKSFEPLSTRHYGRSFWPFNAHLSFRVLPVFFLFQLTLFS